MTNSTDQATHTPSGRTKTTTNVGQATTGAAPLALLATPPHQQRR